MEFSEDEQCEKEFYLKIFDGYNNKQNPLAYDTKHVANVDLKCLETIQLDFVPYCLTQCDISSSEKSREKILLLSGSDDLIHGYRKNQSLDNISRSRENQNLERLDNKNESDKKEAISKFYELEDSDMMHLFPEFSHSTPSPAISLSFSHHKYDIGSHRWSAIGCQDGQLQVFQVDLMKGEVLKVFEDLEFAGIGGIHHAKFFEVPLNIKNDHPIFNLIVVPSLERSALYIDINSPEKQLHLDKETQMLERSSDFDSVNGCTILDIDGDGNPEIILGTYGQELIIYKISEDSYPNQELNENTSHDFAPKWKVWMRKSFPYPILAVDGWENVDSCEDSAVSILAVTTIKTIHILQYDKSCKK